MMAMPLTPIYLPIKIGCLRVKKNFCIGFLVIFAQLFYYKR